MTCGKIWIRRVSPESAPDYPYFPTGQFETKQRGFSNADLAAIGSGNAIRLLPRLA